MTKSEVLEIFFSGGGFLTPDTVGRRLRQYRRRTSVYSYLLRLSRQGLLERVRVGTRLAYRLTPRGVARLRYFRERQENGR
jgi:DNA-binding PadR family transcriptional regulator